MMQFIKNNNCKQEALAIKNNVLEAQEQPPFHANHGEGKGGKMKIGIAKSKKGFPTIGVGGGAATNTYEGRWVVGQDGFLLPAIFMAERGNLSQSTSQAIVVLRPGDRIFAIQGRKPVTLDDPETTVGGLRILSISDGYVASEQDGGYFGGDMMAVVEPVSCDEIPEKVIQGLSLYHNRDGRYFVAE